MIISKKHRLLPACAVLIADCLISGLTYARSGVPADSNVGLWPDTFLAKHTKVEEGDEDFPNVLVIVGEPTVTMNDWIAEISFTTGIATPPVTVYYGTYENDVPQGWVRFHEGVREGHGTTTHGPIELSTEKTTTDHRVELDLYKSFLESSNDDINGMNKKEPMGGVVYYRIEVMSPGNLLEVPGARFYDWRFGFRENQIVPAVTEGPFVDQITDSSAIISWDSSLPANGTVIVEVEGGGENQFEARNKNAKHFEVELTGLTPDTIHKYSIQLTSGSGSGSGSGSSDTTISRQFYFNTPPKNATKYTFVVLGDSRGGSGGGEYNFGGTNARIMGTLARAAFAKGAEFIIHTGDMINGYTGIPLDFEMQLKAHKDAIEPIGHYIPFYEIMGNHELLFDMYAFRDDDRQKTHILAPGILVDKEGDKSTEVIFANEFVNPKNGPIPDNEAAGAPEGSLPPYKENVYSFDYGNSRFVVMNNNYWINGTADRYGANIEGYILDDQKDWLLAKFEKTKNDDSIDHLFIFAQEPMFPNSASHVRDGMWYNNGNQHDNEGFDRKYISKRRDEIWQAFVGTGKAVSGNFGDEHQYTRTFIVKDLDGNLFKYPAWHIVSGGSGAPYAAALARTPWIDNIQKFDTQFHYTLFNVDGDRVTLETYNIDNVLIDRFELTKWLDLFNREMEQVFAMDKDGESRTTTARFFGGISLNGKALASHTDKVVVTKDTDTINIEAIIEPEKEHQGQKADIIVIAQYTHEPNDDCEPKKGEYYTLSGDDEYAIWNGKRNTIATRYTVSLSAQLTLTKEAGMSLYNAIPDYQGDVCFSYGYRLHDDPQCAATDNDSCCMEKEANCTMIFNGEPIKFTVQ